MTGRRAALAFIFVTVVLDMLALTSTFAAAVGSHPVWSLPGTPFLLAALLLVLALALAWRVTRA